MSETLLLGIGLLSGLAVWKYAAKPTYLDEARDALFDLRDAELREFFLNRENGLNDPLYVKMRELLNDLLRYTEKASLVSFFITVMVLTKHQNELKKINTSHEREFASEDPEISSFCSGIRESANFVMMRYMIRTSFIGQVLRLVMYGVIAIRTLYCSVKTLHKPIWTATCTAATGAAIVTNLVAHVAPGVSTTIVKSAVEARAMRHI